jgi:hypothetical protein
LERHKISPFVIFSELVADQNILQTGPIEAPDKCAPDEAGSSSDEDLAFFYFIHDLKSPADRR